MFTDEQRKEFIEDGLTEDEIDLLERTCALSETIDMIPNDVEKFIEEFKAKVPDDTIGGMRAILESAKRDEEFFKKLMALNFAMTYNANMEGIEPKEKTLSGLNSEEYKKASKNYFSTLAKLSDSDRKEFLKLIANITPEQKEDMLERLKNN